MATAPWKGRKPLSQLVFPAEIVVYELARRQLYRSVQLAGLTKVNAAWGKVANLPPFGEKMSVKMEWGAFCDTHYRPSLVVMFLPIGLEPADGLLACERIVQLIRPTGDYALKPGRQCVRVAFEVLRDAKRFGRAAQARQSRPEPEWEVTLAGRLVHESKARGARFPVRQKRPSAADRRAKV
jgi:hypothetical protein